jgi:two-component system cell cycle sensor histidine kinase/response regulator CckA
MGKKISFIKFIQLWGITSLLVLGGSIVAFDIFTSYREFYIQVEQMRSDHIAKQKEMIKREVDRVVAMINDEKAQSEKITKVKIKSRVYEAYTIAQHIYQQNKTAKSKAEIKQMILDALRPIRFADKNGYYFATRLDGVEILFADKPELEGLNLLNLRDTNGQYVIKEMIEIVRQTDEGFYEYYWTKPNTKGQNFKKISFVKRFEPFDWFIGTGLYVDDVEASIKKKLMEQINKIRFGANGYIFVDTWQGISLAHGLQPDLIGTNMWETEDSKGNKTTQMLVAAAKKEEGGYVSYWWRKSFSINESPKIAYAKSVPDWKILVGTGVYLDDVETDIAVMYNTLNNKIKTKIFSFALVVALVIAFVLFSFNYLNRRLKHDFNLFVSFFNRTADSDEKIDLKIVKFAEFDRMAEYANKMLITRKRMEKEIQKFKMMADQANHGIAITDLEGNCEYVNDFFAKTHGFTSAELIGQSLAVFYNEKQMKEVNRVNESLVTQGNFSLLEVWHTHKDGTEFPMLMNSIVIKNKNAIPQYIATTAIDLTVQKKLEEQLQQALKMESIGTLAGGIAHDFNNILFPIVGYAEMLLMDTPEDSPVRESLNQIYTSALRAKSLVKQILTFSRQESGELILMKMQPIVKEALKLIRSTIPTTIEIIQDINPDCGVIKADPTQIHQIVMNLATNAYHAMEETGGELKVSLKQVELGEYDIITPDMTPGFYACLTVADTGVGMDKNLTDKIFDPFFTTKAIGKGTGMGLSVVHGIVISMNGAIQVYSEPGKGTQFHVYFPIEKKSFEEKNTQAKEPIQGGTEQILLVDDEEAILSMEKRMLERLGYQVTSRTSSLEALEAFHDSPDKFDLVITDMAMPNMPGDKLSVELTKIRPDIPILLCTGFSETMSEEKATSLGIKGFLLKPIVMKDLAQKIREVLDEN